KSRSPARVGGTLARLLCFSGGAMLPGAAAMRGSVPGVIVLAAVLGGCGVTIARLTERPDKYYQHTVTFTGQITRTQQVGRESLLEVTDADGRRILVRAGEPPEAGTGVWVKVRGLLVPEARVGDRVLYDVVVADRIGRARRPLLAGIM